MVLFKLIGFQWICYVWSDDKCIKILKNCYDVILDYGKVIVCEYFVLVEVEISNVVKFVFQFDVIMMVVLDGKERIEKEFKDLVVVVGF